MTGRGLRQDMSKKKRIRFERGKNWLKKLLVSVLVDPTVHQYVIFLHSCLQVIWVDYCANRQVRSLQIVNKSPGLEPWPTSLWSTTLYFLLLTRLSVDTSLFGRVFVLLSSTFLSNYIRCKEKTKENVLRESLKKRISSWNLLLFPIFNPVSVTEYGH